MSLQFIMGPSGAGKSHYLYQWITSESLENPEKKYIVVVPEQFTMQAQRDLVAASPKKGILNVEVHSFHRLAHRVFEELGENRHMILTDVGKNFVIRKVAGDREAELKVLGSNLKKMGYITEIKSIISEFTQYDIQPEILAEMLEQVKQMPGLYYKLNDIKTVYEGFQDYLQGKYITGEEVLDVFAKVATRSSLLKDSVVVLDGFTGFTPIQNKLLRELLAVCEKVVVTVTMDKKENPYVYQHPYQLFALSKQMVTKLVQIAGESHVSVEEAVCLYDKPAPRFRENEALDFLESHVFRYTKDCYEKEQDNIQIWCAKNPREEIDFVAQEIRRLVRTEHYRYRDVAVIANDMEAYANYIEKIFSDYELPVFMDHKRSILLNSCVEYIRSLLAMADQDFSYESVFRYLRTNLTGIPKEQVDVLENYVLAMGIRGYKKWQEKWIRRTGQMAEADLACINEIRENFISGITGVMEVLKSRHKTVEEVTKALHAFFLKEELQKRVKEYQVKFEEQGELALEKEYAQVYRIVIDLLDQFVELLGNEHISIREYCELLDAGLEEATIGVIPPSLDQVVVGDVERSRIKDVKAVFLIGTNDIYIPGTIKGKGLLSEQDRQQFEQKGIALAPDAKEKTYIQKFYLYLILTKPTHQVYLTYSKTSSEGAQLRQAYLIGDILKLYGKMSVQEVTQSLLQKELTPKSGISCLVKGLWGKQEGMSKEWQELYTWYKRNPKWTKKIEQIVEAAFYHREDSRLTRQTAKELYGELLENSVTRLEKFSACAYAHFLAYGLRLREREIYQFRAVDMGNLFHSAIEKFSKKIEKAGYTWIAVPETEKEAFIEESVEECIVDYGNSILYSSKRNEYMIVRLKRMLRRTVWALTKQLEKGDFVPAGYEISFGGITNLETTNVSLGELGDMRLRGKIDRVDVCETEDKLYVKVIDYKTGEKAFDLGELCYGLQMQLVIYMNAAMEIEKQKHPEKQVIPAGLFYYRIKDPIIEKPETEDVLLANLLKELRPDGMLQSSEEVLNRMDRDFSGASYAIPAERTQGGGLSKRSKILSEEDFQLISNFAKEKVEWIGQQILEGEVGVSPYELGQSTGCDYCPYHGVCGFDQTIPGYVYRKLEKLDNEDAMARMRKEVGAWE